MKEEGTSTDKIPTGIPVQGGVIICSKRVRRETGWHELKPQTGGRVGRDVVL